MDNGAMDYANASRCDTDLWESNQVIQMII